MHHIPRIYKYLLKSNGLYLRVRWQGHEVRLRPGYQIDREGWDGERCLVGTTHGRHRVPAAVINAGLQEFELKIDTVFHAFEMEEVIPDPAQFKEALNPGSSGANETFEHLFTTFLLEESRRKLWAPNTLKSVRQVGNYVRACWPGLRMKDITPEWLDEYVGRQQRQKLVKGAAARLTEGGYSNSVIEKNCRVFRWFLKWAALRGMIDGTLPASWRPRLKTVDRPVVFLTWPELMRFMKLDLPAGSPYERARDLMCFGAFTGLRYSDIMQLRRADVHPDHIEVVTRKTADRLRIELNRHSRALIDKYSGLPDDRVMPYMDTSQMNSCLKAAALMAGITDPVTVTQYYGAERRSVTRPKCELLSSHCGRRSFICNALAMGISPVVVMKWTGHSDYQSMRPYIDVADPTRARAMRLFDAMPDDE